MTGVRRWLRLTLPCAGLVVLYFLVPASPRLPTDAVVLRGIVSLLLLATLVALVVWQLRLQVDEGTDRRIDGLVAAVVAVVVAFSLAFFMLAQRQPSQVAGLHTRVDALYFTMGTLTTVGYGDVHATGQGARVLVLVQMVFNLVFITAAGALLSTRMRTVAAQRIARRSGRE